MDLIETFFNIDTFIATFPFLMHGLGNTVLLACAAIIIGTVLGVGLCLVRLYASAIPRYISVFYIDFFRSIPALVLLILIYYALPFVGIRLSAFVSTTLALSMITAAFTAEICRAGIEGIPRGQFEAAQALGLPFWTTMHKVVLPQALSAVVAPLVSNYVAVFKDTALASVVAMPDLLKQASEAQALMANPTPLMGAALIYLAILWPLIRLVGYLELRARQQKGR